MSFFTTPMATMILDLDPYCVTQAEFDAGNNQLLRRFKEDDIRMILDGYNTIITDINTTLQCNVVLSDAKQLNNGYWVCKFDNIYGKYKYYVFNKNNGGMVNLVQPSYVDEEPDPETFIRLGAFLGSIMQYDNYVLK
jgi:hypothetical protein